MSKVPRVQRLRVGRTPCGCVDRNVIDKIIGSERLSVAPLVGAWIEIIKPSNSKSRANVAPLVGAWIEIS